MSKILLGAGIMYAVAAVYFCAMLSMTGVTTPPGAAPIAAAAWPVTMAPLFWFVPKPSIDCRARSDGGRP